MANEPIISRDPTTLRLSTVAIASSYDASPVALRMQGWNQAVLFCDLTLNTATDVRIKVEVASPVGDTAPVEADWYQQTASGSATATTGSESVPVLAVEWTLQATGKYALPFPVNYKWIRASAKTTGAPGSTTLAIVCSQGRA